MTILETPHLLYCSYCYKDKRIFLSTKEEEKDSFRAHHAACLPRNPDQSLSDPYRGRDWELRGSHPREDKL